MNIFRYILLTFLFSGIVRANPSFTGEAVFIHTDRNEYVAGEHLWYAAYLLNPENGNLIIENNTVYLELLNCSNFPVLREKISITAGFGNSSFVIPDTLGSGSYILRAYTNLMKNFPPEHCFMKVINIYNTFSDNNFTSVTINGESLSPGLILNPDFLQLSEGSGLQSVGERKKPEKVGAKNMLRVESNDSFKRREKITLAITTGSELISAQQTVRLSISVSGLTARKSSVDINDYASVQKPESPVSGPGMEVGKELKFRSEQEGRYLYGRIVPLDQNRRSQNNTVLLSAPGREAYFQYAVTDPEGDFWFKIDIDSVGRDLVIQLDGNPDNTLIRINPAFWDSYPDLNMKTDTKVADKPSYIEDWSINYQLGRVYGISQVSESPAKDYLPGFRNNFYGIPDFELIMADYMLLPVMQEVFFELVPGVIMRSSRAGYKITVSNPRDNKPYVTDATLMVDGVIIRDPSVIAGIKPEDVERIDVVRDEYVTGGYHFFGIVNVITKKGNFESLSLPGNAIRLKYKPGTPGSYFFSPDYSLTGTGPGRIPDYRNTLYWNPDVEVDKGGRTTVEFFASDYISDYLIDIQGFTSAGEPFSAKKVISVVK